MPRYRVEIELHTTVVEYLDAENDHEAQRLAEQTADDHRFLGYDDASVSGVVRTRQQGQGMALRHSHTYR